jgi:hypothetical protein
MIGSAEVMRHAMLAAVLLLASAPTVARAQVGTQSDATGISAVSSTAVGGLLRGGRDAALDEIPLRLCGIAFGQLIRLEADSLAGPDGQPYPPELQRELRALVADRTDGATFRAALAAGAPAERAGTLVQALRGLTLEQDTLGRRARCDYRLPHRLQHAVLAYNALIRSSGRDFLLRPPAELLIIRTLLSTLTEAGYAVR